MNFNTPNPEAPEAPSGANPWGGTPPIPAMPPREESARVVEAPDPNVLELSCPNCNAPLKLRREHVGVNGACIHCSTPIRAIPNANGQIIIESLAGAALNADPEPQPHAQPDFSEPPVISVEAEPATPETPSNSSLWQQQANGQESGSPINQDTPVPPSPWADSANAADLSAPKREETSPLAGMINPLAQTGSAGTEAQLPPEQQTPPPANHFPGAQAGTNHAPQAQPPQGQAQPTPTTMPWANAQQAAPVSEQADFEQFKARSPFEPQPPQEQAQPAFQTHPHPQPQGPIDQSGIPSTGKSAGRGLSKPRRKLNLKWLGWVAALLLFVGAGAAVYFFAPEEKIAQAKTWIMNFIDPALDVVRGNKSTTTPAPGGNATPQVTPGNAGDAPNGGPAPGIPPAETSESSPASSVPAAKVQPPTDPNPDPVSSASDSLRIDIGGTQLLRDFYATPTTSGRIQFLKSPEKHGLSFEAHFADAAEKLPTLTSISMRKQMRDTASGLWFGLFEVSENENPQLHRWIVVEDKNGEFKIDWPYYEQIANNSLYRFFDDTTALPREFTLSLKLGAEIPQDNNPWNSQAVGILLQTPFDSQPSRPIALKKSDYEGLGFSEELSVTNSKIARVQMAWVPSEFNPASRVPVITRLIGWGMWES